ncbi:TonB-dependent receptor [Pelomonas sp. KK5]|uniref:TonB-dependent receptor n=1 Tax=Pelomonas sp. KK5 TaxID=1855730 RepID=UPI001E5346C9|nr:TonB-dependent receptor [Pelomonas sp. KK5]
MSEVENSSRPASAAPRITLLSTLVSLACAAMAPGARAQEAAVQPVAVAQADGASPTNEASGAKDTHGANRSVEATVVITATRRREPQREVPMQVQAIAAEKLQEAGARQLTDYMADLPGVNVNSAGAGYNTVSIRGVTTGSQTISTVGIYIDDVAFGSSNANVNGAQTALDLSLLDLNHIEVLRGPQGTLYGAGAMGGLLKYVTNEPDTYELSGKVTLGASATKGGGIGHTESAVLNVPLKEDVAALRVALFHDHAGGYVDAVGPAAGRNLNKGDSNGGRISLLLQPSSKLKARLTALSAEIKRDGHDYVDYNAATGEPVAGDYKRTLSVREPFSTKVQLVSADIEAELGWARFNSITSAQSSGLSNHLDFTALYGPLLGATVDTVPLNAFSKLRKQTQEFRLTSTSNSNLEWLGGIFYTHESGANDQFIESTLPNGGGPGPTQLSVSLPSHFTELAAYGDITWKATPRLSITGGIRIARNRQDFAELLSGPLSGGGVNLNGRSKETSKTYLATASYALDPTSNIYVRAASGYRPGGPNSVVYDPATGQPLAPPTFNHDSLWSYEAGYKADLLDKTLSLEASVYDIRWHDLQQFTSVNGFSVITNGGKAQVDGAEFSLRYKPTRDLSFNGSLSYLDARLTEGASGLGQSGAPLPNSARLSASLGARYDFAVAGHAAWVSGSERYVGKRNAGFDGSTTLPNFLMPAYFMTDLQAGVDLQRVQLSMYVRNVFDRRAIMSANTSYVSIGGPVQATVAQPRAIGVTLSTSF